MRKVVNRSREVAPCEVLPSAGDNASEVQAQIARLERENHLLRTLIDQLQQPAETLH